MSILLFNYYGQLYEILITKKYTHGQFSRTFRFDVLVIY